MRFRRRTSVRGRTNAQCAHRAAATRNRFLRNHAGETAQVTEPVGVAAGACAQIEHGGHVDSMRTQFARQLVTLAIRGENGDAFARARCHDDAAAAARPSRTSRPADRCCGTRPAARSRRWQTPRRRRAPWSCAWARPAPPSGRRSTPPRRCSVSSSMLAAAATRSTSDSISPAAAPRPASAAARARVFIHQQHACARIGRRQRRREAARAGADDQHVAERIALRRASRAAHSRRCAPSPDMARMRRSQRGKCLPWNAL